MLTLNLNELCKSYTEVCQSTDSLNWSLRHNMRSTSHFQCGARRAEIKSRLPGLCIATLCGEYELKDGGFQEKLHADIMHLFCSEISPVFFFLIALKDETSLFKIKVPNYDSDIWEAKLHFY